MHQRHALFLALSIAIGLTTGGRAFGQTLTYGINGRMPDVQIGTDRYSLVVRHVVVPSTGVDAREIHLTVTPASGQAQIFHVSASEAQTFSTAITKALALKADNGQTITQSGQTLVMSFESAAVPTQVRGFSMNDNPDGTWFLGIKQPGFPDFSRRYPSASMQQFANYLSLGVAFANALP